VLFLAKSVAYPWPRNKVLIATFIPNKQLFLQAGNIIKNRNRITDHLKQLIF